MEVRRGRKHKRTSWASRADLAAESSKRLHEYLKRNFNQQDDKIELPRASVRFPWPKTHPTELHLACRVLARHVIAAAVLLDGHLALRTLFRVGRNPVRRLAVVAALFRP
jgi:hypothetical protein